MIDLFDSNNYKEIPNEFGRCVDHPILVRSIKEQYSLFSSLIHSSGECLLYHRICSVTKNGKPVDVYELVTSDSKEHFYLFVRIETESDFEFELPSIVRQISDEDSDRYIEQLASKNELKYYMCASLGGHTKIKDFPLDVLIGDTYLQEWSIENKSLLREQFKRITK